MLSLTSFSPFLTNLSIALTAKPSPTSKLKSNDLKRESSHGANNPIKFSKTKLN